MGVNGGNLVLSRIVGEAVVIRTTGPAEILVTLLDIRDGSKARIGFSAPEEVTVNRIEIQAEIDREAIRAGVDGIAPQSGPKPGGPR